MHYKLNKSSKPKQKKDSNLNKYYKKAFGHGKTNM